MTYQVSIEPSGEIFSCEADETLLDGALRHGLNLPHGCRDGVCGMCKGKVLSGSFAYGEREPMALTDDDKDEGLAFYCAAHPTSDIKIECRQVTRADEFPIKLLPARVERMEKMAPDVIELGLRLPATEVFRFRPGQYIDLLLKDGQHRSYSIANASAESGLIELHIRHVPGGAFSTQLFQGMKLKDILRFEGPRGTFWLQEESVKPIIFLASGTGFAPIKAMLEYCFLKGITRPMTLYWGGRHAQDLYHDNLVQGWVKEHAHFSYVPVLSDVGPNEGWKGRTGFVHAAVKADFPDLSGHEVYACGVPAMVEAALRDFVLHGNLPMESLFSDAFTFAVPKP